MGWGLLCQTTQYPHLVLVARSTLVVGVECTSAVVILQTTTNRASTCFKGFAAVSVPGRDAGGRSSVARTPARPNTSSTSRIANSSLATDAAKSDTTYLGAGGTDADNAVNTVIPGICVLISTLAEPNLDTRPAPGGADLAPRVDAAGPSTGHLRSARLSTLNTSQAANICIPVAGVAGEGTLNHDARWCNALYVENMVMHGMYVTMCIDAWDAARLSISGA
jgi:hypothetical protein